MTDTEALAEAVIQNSFEADIEAAQAAGDDERAQALYLKSQGLDTGDDAAEPGDDVGESSDIGPPPDGEWTFDRPEVVDHQFKLMEADFGDLATDLKAEWGADAGQNLEFALATSREFEEHYPEVVSTIMTRGAGHDPLVIELLAVLGRQWAETPGDPTTVRLFPNGQDQETSMTNTIGTKVQAQIEALEDQIDKAAARNDTDKANRLYQEQQALYRRQPGGREPIVGSEGRTA